MSGYPRTLVLSICAAHPRTGDNWRQLWVCGRQPGHTGLHIDVEGLGTWSDETEATL